jgi:FKBP-type peptidyl-prolyl cis-trans isomerase SlyD
MSQQVVSFHYKLTNHEGIVLDSSEGAEPFSFFVGAKQIIPGLEKEVIQLQVGDKKQIHVASNEAYGQRNDELVLKSPVEKLPAENVKVGDQFRGGDGPDSRVFTVIDIADGEATLDGNHPLAGADLIFDVEIIDIRTASEEEVQHGHAHGKGGHH